ncbi:MAG: DUF4270 family protein [Parabacteroides sp.]|nr:DUF4270 family protein [Parabacteroides sp.]
MKKMLIAWGLLLWGSSLFSCYDESNSFGSTLVDSSFRNITIDSSTVVVTSSVIDSIETNGQGVALIGQYTHPSWGTVSSCAYIPYLAPTYSTSTEEEVQLDSLVLALSYNGYSIGDTSQPMRLTVHRLNEKIILNENGYLYNHSSFFYDPEPIASCTFWPKPSDTAYVEIRLPDELGEDFLTRLHARDDGMESERFEDYFKGLVVVPDPGVCQSLISFNVGDTASALILHYRIEEAIAQEAECVITANTEKQFYHIDHDRTATDMSELIPLPKEVPSNELTNRGVLFGGLGWYSYLSFPYLNDILQQGERVSIESAYLKICPQVGSWTEFNTLPDSLYLYIIDENNVVTDVVTDYQGEEVQTATLIKDDSFRENTYYLFDVSTFMQEELGASGQYKHSLMLMLNETDYVQTFRNMTFWDQQGDLPIVLQLTYKIYESY